MANTGRVKKCNLAIRAHEIIAVHKLCPYETTLVFQNPKYSAIGPNLGITHEVHFTGSSIPRATMAESLANPNHDIGIITWFAAASAIDRPSHSKALVFLDQVLYFMTWTDILGSGHGRQSDPRRFRDGRMVSYLRLVTNEEHRQLIFEHVRKLFQSYAR